MSKENRKLSANSFNLLLHQLTDEDNYGLQENGIDSRFTYINDESIDEDSIYILKPSNLLSYDAEGFTPLCFALLNGLNIEIIIAIMNYIVTHYSQYEDCKSVEDAVTKIFSRCPRGKTMIDYMFMSMNVSLYKCLSSRYAEFTLLNESGDPVTENIAEVIDDNFVEQDVPKLVKINLNSNIKYDFTSDDFANLCRLPNSDEFVKEILNSKEHELISKIHSTNDETTICSYISDYLKFICNNELTESNPIFGCIKNQSYDLIRAFLETFCFHRNTQEAILKDIRNSGTKPDYVDANDNLVEPIVSDPNVTTIFFEKPDYIRNFDSDLLFYNKNYENSLFYILYILCKLNKIDISSYDDYVQSDINKFEDKLKSREVLDNDPLKDFINS